MAKSEHSKDLNDKKAYEIVSRELSRFNDLVKGHEKLLRAIAEL
ncbi:MAG: hypothetical protein Q8R47_00630 [Nanoarchaeota archaeon]|nr:hypothetical protein [Nanoarchaeota archaeon]